MVACILAGGKARRLQGMVKSYILIKGQPIIEWQKKVLEIFFSKILLIGNVHHPSLDTVSDAYQDTGPLGGIYTALLHTQSSIFVFPSDNPFISKKFIEHMLTEAKNQAFDALIPQHDGKIEPLYGIYSPSAISAIKKQLDLQEFAIYKTLAKINTRYIDWSEEIEKTFFNINYPEDILKAQTYARTYVQ